MNRMHTLLLWCCLLLGGQLAQAQPQWPAWRHRRYAQAAPVHATFLSSREKEVLRLCNLARLNGPLFAATYVQHYLPDSSLPAVASLLQQLRQQAPMQPLQPHYALQKSASLLGRHMAVASKKEYEGTEAGPFYDRIHQFYPAGSTFASNYLWGSLHPTEVALRLLLDEADPQHNNRRNLLSPHIGLVGLVVWPHPSLCGITAMDFAQPASPAAPSTKPHRSWNECPPGAKVHKRRGRRR